MQKTTHRGHWIEEVFTFVENTIGNSPKVLRAKFLGSDGLFCFTSICKFGSFKNLFTMITSLSELYFRFRSFLCWYKRKKWFLWTMTAAQSAENHGDELDLTWYLRWEIYTSIPTSTYSKNSPPPAEALNIMIMKTLPISTKIVKLYNEMGHPVVNLMESQWKVR